MLHLFLNITQTAPAPATVSHSVDRQRSSASANTHMHGTRGNGGLLKLAGAHGGARSARTKARPRNPSAPGSPVRVSTTTTTRLYPECARSELATLHTRGAAVGPCQQLPHRNNDVRHDLATTNDANTLSNGVRAPLYTAHQVLHQMLLPPSRRYHEAVLQ